MKLPIRLGLSVLALACWVTGGSVRAETVRDDFVVESADGMDIFVRRIRSDEATLDRGPMLLVNGGRPGVLASWDVDVPGPSAAEEFARAGHVVYLMDVRGFGRSEFPETMQDGRFEAPIAVRSHEAVRDIEAVVGEIGRRHPDEERLAAIGWATGSQWLGHYASLYPDAISHLVYYQGAYGGPAGGWAIENVSAAGSPARLDYESFGAYRCSTAESLVGRLRQEGAGEALLARYIELAMEGDEEANTHEPPCFRVPSGPMADTLMMVNGRPIFDAAVIRSHVLILRSENDFWSRPTDAATLRDHLMNAASIEVRELADASHFAHIIPGDGRRDFLSAVLAFTDPRSRAEATPDQ